MSLTKADLRRVQHSLDWFRCLIRDRGVRSGKEREHDAYVREHAARFVVDDLRRTATGEGMKPREQRAAARLAERIEAEGLPAGVTLPLLCEEPEANAAPVAVLREDSGPTPLASHPLPAPIDDALAAAYAATYQRASFIPLREWSLCDGSDAPTLHWHAWASSTAKRLGVARPWAALAGASVPDDHPDVAHVQRVLVAAGEAEEPPRGIVALDLRGLGLRCVRPLAEALVAAARARATAGDRPRGAVLVCDHYPAVTLGRLVRLAVE